MADDLREVLLTLTPAQFDEFARDLALLRADGAESNTHAVIDAVRASAARARVRPVDDRRAA